MAVTPTPGVPGNVCEIGTLLPLVAAVLSAATALVVATTKMIRQLENPKADSSTDQNESSVSTQK